MTGKTHLAVGALTAAAIMLAVHEQDIRFMAAEMSCCALGALVPDIDHPGSRIARKNVATAVASRAVHTVARHRGVIHSLWFCFLFAALFYAGGVWLQREIRPDITAYLWPCTKYFFAGCVSHLAADSLTNGGINWLPPLTKKKLRLARMRTGSGKEYIFLGVVLAALAAVLYAHARYLAGQVYGVSISEMLTLFRQNLHIPW